MGWVNGTSATDADAFWANDDNIWDGDSATYAVSTAIATNTWGDGAGGGYIACNIAAIECSKVKVWADYNIAGIDEISIDVYYDAAWHNIYEGIFSDYPAGNEKAIGSTETVTACRVTFYNEHDTIAQQAWCRLIQFWDTLPALAGSIAGDGALAAPLTLMRYMASSISGDGTLTADSIKLVNKIWPKFILEIHDSSGNLISILENAYDIRWVQELNKAHQLGFSMPIDDAKRADILLANEIWLRDYRSLEVLRKFILSSTREIRK